MSRDFKRTDRVGAEMQRELAELLREEIKDSTLGIITLQEVRVVRDFSQAKVFFTAMAGQHSHQEVASHLNQAAGHLRWLLGRQMKLRTVPKLIFVYDESVEAGEHLAALIDRAVADREAE
jgi:ribosome-binding factor A